MFMISVFRHVGSACQSLQQTTYYLLIYSNIQIRVYMGVSKNRGTPKWMVYNGKLY